MTKLISWRNLVTFATIDAFLVFAAGSAMAAPGATLPAAGSSLPTLLLLGVGLISATLRRGAAE
jgi:hypothetical protein